MKPTEMSEVDLLVAAETQNILKLREILNENRSLADQQGYKGNTVVIFIAQWGYRELLLAVLEYQPNVNVQNEAINLEGDSALLVAAKAGYYEICVDLIQAGAFIDVQNKEGLTPLMEACRFGHKFIVQLLVYAEADLELMDKKGSSALIHASMWGNREIMDELISHGARLNNRYFLPEEYQGNKLEAKIKLKQRLLERKLPEGERIRRQRGLIEKYYYDPEGGGDDTQF